MNSNKQKEIISRSHQRSKDFGVEKERVYSKKILVQNQLEKILENSNSLLQISMPFIENIYKILAQSGFIIVLTDNEGCILYIKGEDDTIKAAQEINMIQGAYMDEKSIGTNAMGTAISENIAVQITAKEHFVSAYHKWTCSAAPIHDCKGNIIGTLNLTADKIHVHPHTLGLVISAVQAIEHHLKNIDIQKQLVNSQNYAFALMNHLSFGVFAIDEDDNILWANDTACRIINIKRSLIIHRPFMELIKKWNVIKHNLLQGNTYSDQEGQFNLKDIQERFFFNCYKMKSEGHDRPGFLVTFHPIHRFINLANKVTGLRAKYSFDDIICKSQKMKEIVEYAKVVSNNPSTILITGESGTGKEVFAQSIHQASERRESNFVAINCGAIPSELIESELYGYEEGAFTGAKKGGKQGKFELANGGTIFLDEIGEMPMDMQVKLLRTIQEGYIVKVGGNHPIDINTRIIAATNKDLKAEIDNGNFRLDLFYRLNVIEINIPSLKDRRDDIIPLTRYFLQLKAEKLARSLPQIPDSTYDDMLNYQWPGNIRELENFVEKAVILNGEVGIEKRIENKASTTLTPSNSNYTRIKTLQEMESDSIKAAIAQLKGNMTQVAKALNIGRNTLYMKMKKYRISHD